MRSTRKPSYLNFDLESYPWKAGVDYKKHPEQYRVGKVEQGVLICEPYKSKIGRYWRFRTEVIARESSERIFGMFKSYIRQNDFVGADMSRKYLQMGYTVPGDMPTKGGKKFDREAGYSPLERGTGEEEKQLNK
ncbi:DUF4385 family protein [Pedobacter xixiisoli]|nr:DUF4385 family protein [Pedobacter xixiisoli]